MSKHKETSLLQGKWIAPVKTWNPEWTSGYYSIYGLHSCWNTSLVPTLLWRHPGRVC